MLHFFRKITRDENGLCNEDVASWLQGPTICEVKEL